jgi:hypothetical protein
MMMKKTEDVKATTVITEAIGVLRKLLRRMNIIALLVKILRWKD